MSRVAPEAVPDLYRLAYIPGVFECPQCGFVLFKTTLNVASGETGTQESDRESEPCPNDGSAMMHVTYRERCADLEEAYTELHRLLNTPEIEDFDKAVPLESAHQVQRWGSQHDAGKKPEDWFWLIGYLAGKALFACISGNEEKAKHHCISTAAALRNWHAHIRSGSSAMRPGLSAEATAGADSQGGAE